MTVDSSKQHNYDVKKENEYVLHPWWSQKFIDEIDKTYVDAFLQNNGADVDKLECEIEKNKQSAQITQMNHITHKIATFDRLSESPDSVTKKIVKENYKNNKYALNYFNNLSDYERCHLVEKELNSYTNDKRYNFHCKTEKSDWLIYDRFHGISFQTDHETNLELDINLRNRDNWADSSVR